MTTWYAPRKLRCVVCLLPASQWAEVNAVIWDGMVRRVGYGQAAIRAYEAQSGRKVNEKTIYRHADHIEATWHTTPQNAREKAVFPSDYESVTEKAAGLSARAMERLESQVDDLDPKDLIAAAKLGIAARQHQETLKAKDRRTATTLDALFGIAAGLVGALPEGEVVDTVEVEGLYVELAEERKLLEAHARGS
jgi:hypothetical protein